MLNEENRKLCAEVVKKNGHGMQMIKAVEEFSELTQAICKTFGPDADMENAREELADAEVMIEQLLIIFGVTDEEQNERSKEKLLRTLKQ